MRKILLIIAFYASTIISNAEIFIGGIAGFAYSNEVFSMTVAPCAGYEFNEKFAVGTGGGITLYDQETVGIINPFFRFTPCQNERVAFDLKLQSNIQLNDGEIYTINGISPCLRTKISKHFEFSSEFGIFGFESHGDCSPLVSLKNVNINASIIYRIGK